MIAKVNQPTSPATVSAKFAGDNYYVPATATGSVAISTPTTLSVSSSSGTYGQPTTILGTLTNSVTGAPISGQTVTLTLNGTQTCTATTSAMGQASCSVTPKIEPSVKLPRHRELRRRHELDHPPAEQRPQLLHREQGVHGLTYTGHT